MRMTRGLTTRLRQIQDERGAVAAIVVISLIALLGMLVLTVDLGGMLTMRRRMVAGADSAALAGAQSCARELPSEAASQADALAIDNEAKATRVAFSTEGCGGHSTGTVHVSYRAPVDLQFAPVLGLPAQTRVGAAATAEWGPAGGLAPLPIVVSLDSQRRIPCVWQSMGAACNYWYDNGASDFSNSSNWGFLNLSAWGVGAGDSCPSAGTSTRRDWINSIDVPDISIGSQGFTLVCADTGHSTSSWFTALAGLVGKIRFFPVNDQQKMVLSPPGKEKYAIVGFTALKIEQVLRGDDPAAVGTPGDSGGCSDTVGFGPGTQVNVDLLSGPGCPRGARPDSISGVTLTSGNGAKKMTYREGSDYTYDSSAHVIRWLGPAQSGVDISFGWSTNGVAGACGIHKRDPNGVCLVATWQGAQVGGTRPGGGQDFGVRAIRLKE